MQVVYFWRSDITELLHFVLKVHNGGSGGIAPLEIIEFWDLNSAILSCFFKFPCKSRRFNGF